MFCRIRAHVSLHTEASWWTTRDIACTDAPARSFPGRNASHANAAVAGTRDLSAIRGATLTFVAAN